MSEIALYDVLGQSWRWGKDERGVYAAATDLAKTFDYSRSSDMLSLLDDAEKGAAEIRTPGGVQKLRVVYEDGIWELIFRSTKPEARGIKNRVKQILRELRTDGVVVQEGMPEALRVRADEKFSYHKLKDFITHASDYDPNSEDSRKAFARLQNMLYAKFVGLDATSIKSAREINVGLLKKTRKDGKPYAADLKVAKNYLDVEELADLNNAALGTVGMLGLYMRPYNGVYTMKDVHDTLARILDSV